jgi:RHS repeat-associated protein
MESLQECRDPSRAICFPATQFDWLKSEHALSPVGKTLAGLLPEDMSGLNIADVNGDGKPDLLVTTKQGKNYQLRVSQFNASGGFDPLSWSVELPKASKNSPVTVQVMDINADGYHDLLYPSDTNGIQWVVRLGSEQGLSSESVVGEGALMNPAVVQVMDFDGDGLADLLHNRRNASDTGNELVMLRNIRSPGGTHRLAEPVVIGIDLTGLFPLQTGDGWFLSDEFPNIGVNEDSAVGARVFDYNADGRVDLLLNVNRLYEACDQNCTNPSEVPTDQPDQTGRQFEARFGITALATSRDADNVRKGGGKGGGVETARASFWVLFESDAESGFVQRDVISAGIDCEVAEICLPYAGSGAAVNIRPADLNADGLADVVYHDESGTWFSRTNTGLTFLPAEVIAHTPADLSVFARLEDWNGDGLPDLAYPDSIEASARWLVMFNNQGSTFSAPLEGGVPAGAFLEGDASLFADFSGDGKRDFLFIDRDTYGQLSAVTLHQGINLLTGSKQEEAVNVLQNIRHGLGSRIGINWLPLTNTTVYTRYAQSAVLHWGRGSPVYDLIAPIYVVSQVSQSAPVMGDAEALRSLQYGYFGARIQAGGRGLLGFAEMVTFDPQTAIRTNTRYRQDFPFIGLAVDTTQAVVAVGQGLQALTSAVNDNEIFRGAADLATTPPALSPGESLLAYRYNEWAASPSVGAEKARVISLNGTVEQQFTLAGNLDRKSVSSHRYDSSGNQLESTVSTYDGNQSVAFASRAIHNQWAPDDPLRWLPGRLLSATVTHARAGASSISRSTAYDYDAESGLLVRETTEPLDARFRVVTEYLLDSFGNRIRKTVTGEGMTPRSVSSQWDSLGRWVTRSSNVYGQTTLKVLETDIFGNLLVTEDIDSVVTTIAADAMGRSYGRYTQTGAWSASTQVAGSGSICPQETAYHVVTVTGGAGSRYRCLDSIGREIRNSVPGFSGRRIFSDQYHDINGRQVLQSEPYFSGDTRYWNTMRYDRMGRVLEAQSADGNRVLYAYDESADSQCITGGARSRRSTNALGQVTSENRNPLGETIEVFDQQCGRVGFTHDAVGNLTSTSGVDGETVTVSWDRMGRKTSLSDPDKGLWRYAYNPLGEMTRQLDSKGQAIDFEYDVLGRVTEKRELRDVGSVTDASFTVVNVEITSYENSSSANARGKGRPESISYRTGESGAILHKRDFIYDGFGRPDIVTTTIGNQQFNEQTTYDEYGRVFQQFDASGDDHGLRYVYSSGFLKQLKEARAGVDGVVYQDVMAMDARGNVTAMQLGNNVSVHASHDPVNGRLQRIEAFDNYGVALQEVDYLFDLLGNLKQRHDQSAGNDHKEDFTYDDLNRLQQVQLTAPTLNINSPVTTLSLAYNQSGNISHKSDVGNYLYDGAQPHAVTSAGGVNYSYDANGNQVSGDGRSINYTVYDKPDTISRGQSQVVFSYGIGNSRYQRQDREANVLQKTTLYLGPTERISENGSTFFKRYLGGVAIADYFPESGIQQLNYLLKDHLGSIHTVLDENGLIVARMYFSAFGERQEANWQTPMTSFLYTPLNDLTTRGFTGHEQVDSMGIIHMNGRIYDPRLGRFLQADPVVQAPKNGQSLNRYSYALNNPLSYTDPSGYFSLKRFFKKWGRVIFAAAAAYFTYGAAFTWAANSIASGVANSLTLAKIVGNVGWKVVAGAVAGASSGFVAGAIISRSLRGAVKGALAGAITGGVVGYHGDSYNLGRIASESLGGGVSAKILGGKFEDGLKFALVVSSVTYINYRMDLAERINSAKNSDNLNKPGSRLFGRKYSLAGARRTVSADGSYLPCGSPAGGCQGLPIPGNLDQASNLIGIPYNPEGPLGYIVDTFAGPHDWLRNHISGSYDVLGNSRYLTGIEKLIDEFANAALIPVAAPFSAAALLGTQPALYLTTLENIYGD